jgi:hypothetical protein
VEGGEVDQLASRLCEAVEVSQRPPLMYSSKNCITTMLLLLVMVSSLS